MDPSIHFPQHACPVFGHTHTPGPETCHQSRKMCQTSGQCVKRRRQCPSKTYRIVHIEDNVPRTNYPNVPVSAEPLSQKHPHTALSSSSRGSSAHTTIAHRREARGATLRYGLQGTANCTGTTVPVWGRRLGNLGYLHWARWQLRGGVV